MMHYQCSIPSATLLTNLQVGQCARTKGHISGYHPWYSFPFTIFWSELDLVLNKLNFFQHQTDVPVCHELWVQCLHWILLDVQIGSACDKEVIFVLGYCTGVIINMRCSWVSKSSLCAIEHSAESPSPWLPAHLSLFCFCKSMLNTLFLFIPGQTYLPWDSISKVCVEDSAKTLVPTWSLPICPHFVIYHIYLIHCSYSCLAHGTLAFKFRAMHSPVCQAPRKLRFVEGFLEQVQDHLRVHQMKQPRHKIRVAIIFTLLLQGHGVKWG
jgi:hypothetical protein